MSYGDAGGGMDCQAIEQFGGKTAAWIGLNRLGGSG